MNKRSIALVFFILLAAGFLSSAASAAPAQIKVKVATANIRKGPSLQSQVVLQAPSGSIFDVISKSGEWYLIDLSPMGTRSTGYIHVSVVEDVTGYSPAPQPQLEKRRDAPTAAAAPFQKVPPDRASGMKKIFLRLDGSMGLQEESLTASWTDTIYYEDAASTIIYDIEKGYAFSGAVGYRLTRSLGVEIGADIYSHKLESSYASSIPHPLIFQSPRSAEGSDSSTLSETAVFLNAVLGLHMGRLGIDVFAGPAYFMAKAPIYTSIGISDTYPYDTVILTAEQDSKSVSTFGFDAGLNLFFHFSDSLALGAGARYLYGKAEFDTGTDLPSPEIMLGGLKIGAGLKLMF